MHDRAHHIADLLIQTWRLDVFAYDEAYLVKCVNRRMEELDRKSFVSYCKLIQENHNEAKALFSSLNNSYTELFRNSLTFSYLEQVVLPLLIAKKKNSNQKELRIWSAACASGHEAYSVAILCDELIQTSDYPIAIRVFATDNNKEELLKASKGMFNSNSISNLSYKRYNQYLQREGDELYLIKRVKDLVDISFFDLLSDENTCPPASIFGSFDLIFCSNVLFYYKPEFQVKIIEKVKNCLAENAYFVTGEAEVDIVKKLRFKECFTGSAVFKTLRRTCDLLPSSAATNQLTDS